MKPLKPLSATDRGPREEQSLIPLWASITMLMQLMQHLGIENSLRILDSRLSGDIELKDVNKQSAKDLFENFFGVLNKALKSTKKKGVLLFNYCLGDVNKQHDANDQILNQVKGLAEKNEMVVLSIPMMGSNKMKEKAGNKFTYLADRAGCAGNVQTDHIFEMPPGVPKHKMANFWKLVAQYLQIGSKVSKDAMEAGIFKEPVQAIRCVHGLIDGRSGSMDLPAFVGVKCLSWDEPFVNDAQYDGPDANSQGPQLLRLLNERPVMSVCYLDPKSRVVKPDEKSRDRLYSKLNERDDIVRLWLEQPDTVEQAMVNRESLLKLYGDTLDPSKLEQREKVKLSNTIWQDFQANVYTDC